MGRIIENGSQLQFAHRTFAWQSEARGAAHVHVVIVGFSLIPTSGRRIFDYEHIKADPIEVAAKTINPYLVDAANLVKIMPNAQPFHFGILSSSMHMAWVRTVCGRLKSDHRYSAKLVYNNFPWPQNVTDTQRDAVESAAQLVLDTRDEYSESSLADLYDLLSMPAPLTKAHAKLDRAVDRCYRSQPFPHERNRVEFLFEQYQALLTPLVFKTKVRKSK